jgi:hypothetical protein
MVVGGETAPSRLTEAYGRLPMSFAPNQGQADGRVRFLSHGRGYSLFLTSTEAVFALKARARHEASERALRERARGRAEGRPSDAALVRMKLIDANPPVFVEGIDPLPGRSHYFTGGDPRRWRTDVPIYRGVRYANVYEGVDLVYHGNQEQLEYDFVVAPGADVGAIRVAFPGVDAIEVDATGDLVLRLAGHEVRQHRPIAYQERASVRREIPGRYALDGEGRVGFEVAEYDRSQSLVIDPVLVYSTYLGGSGSELGFNVGSIQVDAAGSAYVTGWTTSTDFPTTDGAFQPASGGGADPCVDCDAFVSKLDPTGSALVYSTYLGGSRSEVGAGIAVDPSGNAYVTGSTNSADFPTTPGALDRTCPSLPGQPAGECFGKVFVTKLDPSGSALVYSTYLGATTGVQATDLAAGTAITVDGAGNAYVAGNTGPNFPTTGAFRDAYGGGQLDGFAAKVDAAGSTLLYAGFLGGGSGEQVAAIAIDPSANIYVTGFTFSADFPTTADAFQRTCPFYPFSPGGCLMAFATKVDASGSALAYSTYLGGATEGSSSQAASVAVDQSGDAYVTGVASGSFPTTAGAFQTVGGGADDAFVTKLDAGGASLVYSTYLGGSSFDGGTSITLDGSGRAHVTGWTWSTDFPVEDAVQPSLHGVEDAFVAKLDAAGSSLIYSTYLGGSGSEAGTGITIDAAGSVYVLGATESVDFPTSRPLQPAFGGGLNDYFVAKIGDEPCAEEVTGRVDVVRSRFYGIPFIPLRLQAVSIRNDTTDPIAGPLSYVLADLQNAVLLGSRKTFCFPPDGNSFITIGTGSDGVLGPDERVFRLLLFLKTERRPIAYAPRVLSGIPAR